jgi:hypothetical protein
MLPNRLRLPVEMLAQPDEISCGSTCLHAIYRYWGEQESLSEVVTRTEHLEYGGTLATTAFNAPFSLPTHIAKIPIARIFIG